MKARTINRKDRERLCSEVWEHVEHCINVNRAIFIIALARHTGWRRKRLQEFIKAFNAVMDEYHGFELDGVFDEMLEYELHSFGLDKEQVIPKGKLFSTELKNQRAEKKSRDGSNVKMQEAERLHRELAGFKNYLSEGLKNDKN